MRPSIRSRIGVISAELLGAQESAQRGDLHDRQLGLRNQAAGAVEAQVEIVTHRGKTDVTLEYALQLAHRKAEIRGQFG